MYLSYALDYTRPLLLLALSGLAAINPVNAQQLPRLGAPPVAPKDAAELRTVVPSPSAGRAVAGLSVDTSDRQASLNFYTSVYLASQNIASGWTGSTLSSVAGTTAQPYRDAIALRVNYFRAMAGVPAAITFSDAYNAKDEQAALMMSLNNQLSHTPPITWLSYTADGAEAASNSNLFLGLNGPAAVSGYVEDPGDGNAAVGHRRWIFYPQTQTMGSGDVDGTNVPPAYSSANALWVVDSNYFNPRPQTRDGFVAWPPPGYVPYNLIYTRWSVSYPNADFSQSSVSMTKNGQSVAATLETPHTGYAENTLVWTPQGLNLVAYDPSSGVPVAQQEPTIHVTVSNVLVNGAATSFSYDVKSFDPQPATAGQAPAFFNGDVALGGGVRYLAFEMGNVFGYYEFLSTPGFFYHFDMGFEYYLDAKDGRGGLYLYDFTSSHWFYTSPTFAFPYLYDFTLGTFVYYYPSQTNPQRYNTNGLRWFYRTDTGVNFHM